jgi:very-short-patch-repair endonuclease
MTAMNNPAPLRPDASTLERKFAHIWNAIGGPPLECEVKWHPKRKWRFDYCHPGSRVAVELEGGIWLPKSRHFHGSGAVKDMEKYLAATVAGWLVIRLTGLLITPDNIEDIIKLIEDRLHANRPR